MPNPVSVTLGEVSTRIQMGESSSLSKLMVIGFSWPASQWHRLDSNGPSTMDFGWVILSSPPAAWHFNFVISSNWTLVAYDLERD